MIHLRGISTFKVTTLLICFVSLGTMRLFGTENSSAAPGLSVNSQGMLMRHGAPYRGIGVNYYDAFLRTLRDPNDTSYRAGFAKLGENEIPFARLAAGGYLGQDFQLFLTDKDAYFRLLDGVVRAAETSHVGLIASLFWNISAVSKAVHEPLAVWGDSTSKTRQFMRTYTHDVVSRYASSPAIWGWEFSCELSLPMDLRQGQGIRPHHINYDTFQDAALDFARVVRGIDSSRILLTGNSLPRAAAYHNANSGPITPDTEAQFAQVLLRDNPGPFSPICIHSSPASIARYFADRRVSYQELLKTCIRIGRTVGKPVYLEEFVPNPGRGPLARTSERAYVDRELEAIEGSKVPLASLWVYDRRLSADRSNTTFDNQRSYILRKIADSNRSVRAQ